MVKKNIDVCYKSLRAKDAFNVAQLYIITFPHNYLTELGIEFMSRYFTEVIEYNKSSIGAYGEGQLRGFILGGINVNQAQSNYLKKNLLFCCWKFFVAFIESSIIRKHIFYMVHYILNEFSRIKVNNGGKRFLSARLYSISVHPDFKGTGIYLKMLKKFEKNLSEKKIKTYTVSVKKENKRAIFFFKKNGLFIEKETENGLYFRKEI